MTNKNTAVDPAPSMDAITKGSQPSIGCPRFVTKCRKPTSRLYQQSLELEDNLRYSLPSYAVRYLDEALLGDIDAADSLLWSAPNNFRGGIAVLFYLRGSSPKLQQEFSAVPGAATMNRFLWPLSSRPFRSLKETALSSEGFVPESESHVPRSSEPIQH